jgi:predicted DNA binding CopG/RHH family protein
MKREMPDWSDLKLVNEEIELLKSVESGEWKSNNNIDDRKNELRMFFSENNSNHKSISINIKSEDFDYIESKSNQFGINNKELIEKLVHNFAIGKFVL